MIYRLRRLMKKSRNESAPRLESMGHNAPQSIREVLDVVNLTQLGYLHAESRQDARG